MLQSLANLQTFPESTTTTRKKVNQPSVAANKPLMTQFKLRHPHGNQNETVFLVNGLVTWESQEQPLPPRQTNTSTNTPSCKLIKLLVICLVIITPGSPD